MIHWVDRFSVKKCHLTLLRGWVLTGIGWDCCWLKERLCVSNMLTSAAQPPVSRCLRCGIDDVIVRNTQVGQHPIWDGDRIRGFLLDTDSSATSSSYMTHSKLFLSPNFQYHWIHFLHSPSKKSWSYISIPSPSMSEVSALHGNEPSYTLLANPTKQGLYVIRTWMMRWRVQRH